MGTEVIDHLDTIRRQVQAMDSGTEDSLEQLPALFAIRDAADAAARGLLARGLKFLDADLKEYDEVRRESQRAAEGGSNDDEIKAAREEASSLYGALDLALRLLGKDGLE